MVPEHMTGSRIPRASNSSSIANNAGLGVERVEHGLHEQNVGATIDQAARILAVCIGELTERHIAEAGIVDVGRYRGRAARGRK
jgi:hypothetical protein